MSKSKVMALIGAILNTATTILLIVQVTANGYMTGFVKSLTEAQKLQGVKNPPAFSTTMFLILMVGIALLGCLLAWLSFIKIDTPTQKGWKIYLLVAGILSVLVGAEFTYGAAILPAIFFILAFAFKGKMVEKLEKPSFEPFWNPEKPVDTLKPKSLMNRNPFLILLQLVILLGLDYGAQNLMARLGGNLKQHTMSTSAALISVLVMLIASFLAILWGRKVIGLEWKLSNLTKRWRLWLFGLPVVFTCALIMAGIVSRFIKIHQSVNQQDLNALQNHIPIYLMLVMACIMAPVIEESIFRVGFFELILKKHAILAWIASSAAFSFIHLYHFGTAIDWQSFPSYFALGFGIGWAYWKTRRVEVSAALHGTWNLLVTVIPLLLVK